MRPATLDEYLGQDELLGEGRALRAAIEQGVAGSLILFGPPGVGKTTLGLLISKHADLHFEPFSAVLSGVAQVREAVAEARRRRQRDGRGTLLFVDEIHRFNKAQQDALLPHVEQGTVTLIGATTENPSFAVNAALLSRARVFRLEPLPVEAIRVVLERALVDAERGLGGANLHVDPDALLTIAHGAKGDARRALSVLELVADHARSEGESVSLESVEQALAQKTLLYDKSGEEHYNVVSAFIKSMRGS
ncbi:MAG: AAA family ATPase, partial [Planctomycetes bacterium]|nr:AAA family ATPase [Planctomycetota bacterium]